MKNRKFLIAGIVLLACVWCFFYFSGNQSPSGVLLVTVEGINELPSRVFSEKWSKFDHVYTTSPATLPAATSVLTGLNPPEHGLRVDGIGSLAAETPTLATEYAKKGYETSAFISSIALDPRHGLTNGFSRYEMVLPEFIKGYTNTVSEAVMDAVASAHTKMDSGKNQFVWVHLDASHDTQFEKELSVLFDLFDESTRKVVVQLYREDADADLHGFSVGDEVARVTLYDSGATCDSADAVSSITQIKNRLVNAEDAQSIVYTESITPWYVLRQSPLQVLRGKVGTLPHLGLAEVKPEVLPTQVQLAVLRRDGHLGEGLIPPYTNDFGVAELSADDLAQVKLSAEAFKATGEIAITNLQALVKAHPDVPVYYEMLGVRYGQAKNYTEACNAFAKVSDLGYNMVGAHWQQSMYHTMIGNVPMAIDKAETAFLLNPTDPTLRRGLAQVLYRTGATLLANKDYKSASECLNRVYFLEPKNADVIVQLARLQLEIGQTNSATGLLKGALKIKPSHVPAQQLLKGIQ